MAKSAALLFGVVASSMSFLAAADVYKFVDHDGHVYYTDNPKHKGYQLVAQSPSVGFSTVCTLSPCIQKSASGISITAYGSNIRAGNGRFSEKYRKQLTPLIETVARRYQLDPSLLHAVIRAESGYNPDAVSPAGAVGLMQLMPDTATRYGVQDRSDPLQSLDGGAHYLSDLLDMFASDIRLAVAAYNAGENNVLKYGRQIPPFPETQTYVVRVMDYYYRGIPIS